MTNQFGFLSDGEICFSEKLEGEVIHIFTRRDFSDRTINTCFTTEDEPTTAWLVIGKQHRHCETFKIDRGLAETLRKNGAEYFRILGPGQFHRRNPVCKTDEGKTYTLFGYMVKEMFGEYAMEGKIVLPCMEKVNGLTVMAKHAVIETIENMLCVFNTSYMDHYYQRVLPWENYINRGNATFFIRSNEDYIRFKDSVQSKLSLWSSCFVHGVDVMNLNYMECLKKESLRHWLGRTNNIKELSFSFEPVHRDTIEYYPLNIGIQRFSLKGEVSKEGNTLILSCLNGKQIKLPLELIVSAEEGSKYGWLLSVTEDTVENLKKLNPHLAEGFDKVLGTGCYMAISL